MSDSLRAIFRALRDDVPWRSVAIVLVIMIAVFCIGFTVVYFVNALSIAAGRPLAPNTQPPSMPSNMPGMDH